MNSHARPETRTERWTWTRATRLCSSYSGTRSSPALTLSTSPRQKRRMSMVRKYCIALILFHDISSIKRFWTFFKGWLRGACGRAREWAAPAYSRCTPPTAGCAAPSTSKGRMRCLRRAATRITSWDSQNRTRNLAQRTPLCPSGEKQALENYPSLGLFCLLYS